MGMIPFKPFPWLTAQAVLFLEHFLHEHPQARVLECGSGGSTIWFAQRTKQLVSLEHSPQWFDLVKQELSRRAGCHMVTQILRKKPYDFVLDYFQEKSFDLILIDGQNRVACARRARRLLRAGGILMLDDTQRLKYATLFEEFSDWSLTKTVQLGNDLYPEHCENANDEVWTCWWTKPL